MYWDFITSRQESTYMTMIIFSDLGTPDGYRHINGFGSHTFKMVNATGDAVYVKFHYLVSYFLVFLTKYCVYFKIVVQFYSFYELKAIVIQSRSSRHQFVHNIAFPAVMLIKFMPRLVQNILKIP